LNSHNTRRVTRRTGRGIATGRGMPGAGVHTSFFLIVRNPPVTSGIDTFNPAYLAAAEQDEVDLLYANTTIAELVIIPGAALNEDKSKKTKKKA